MKRALPLALAALLLPACGGSATPPADKPASTAQPATAAQSTTTQPPAAVAPAPQPKTGQADPAALADPASDESTGEGVNELLKVLDNLPTQDELDAAAAARISEATADAEYEKLKAEIEADMAKPLGDG